jgi:hypothetical protein
MIAHERSSPEATEVAGSAEALETITTPRMMAREKKVRKKTTICSTISF